ncbi:uncharacterized protein LOC125862870 [Solanum stenotomum]|uniref:uncharacterized protein LOC125862870 n=1 Tax=Solanum stenotomum TaxID=172797 RepID=UPI0020D151BE|nr:uncharacterized protein LOC125862870 [Solanum stenotomum]
MAIDMISEVTSPRISFSSDDICCKQVLDLQHYQSDSNSEFDFCISNIANTETCSADELFLNGLIRPLQLQQKVVTLSPTSAPAPVANNQNVISKHISVDDDEQKDQNKSFWRIRRSTSLHGNKKSSFWSLPRSNSTGSKSCSVKENQKQKKNIMNPSSGVSFYSSQKPPLRKNYSNRICINPVLNVPPYTFIPKATANLFGLGSYFANGKDKKSKK